MLSQRIRAVILDIDGTLTEDRNTERLSVDAILAVREVVDNCRDVELGIATGNSHIVALSIARYVGFDLSRCPIISENGCVLWYRGTRYELCAEYKNMIDEAREHIISELSEYLSESYQNEYRKYDYAFYIKPGLDPEKALAKVRKLLEDKNLSDKLDVVFSGYALHIIPRGINKGQAVKLYSSVSGIPLENIAAVGDSDTDISLLLVCGIRVAVSNATPNLKAIATIVTSKPSGRGVAEFLREFVLSQCLSERCAER